MNRVVLAEDHRRIAGRVGGADMHEVNLPAVEVEAHAVVEGDGRAGLFRIRLLAVLGHDHVEDVGLGHHLGRVLLRDDPGSGRAQRQVAVGVVEMPVRVDGEIDATATELGDGRLDLGHQFREHVIDDQDALLPHRHRNVAASAEQDIEPFVHLLGGDLHRVEVPAEVREQGLAGQGLAVLGVCCAGQQQRRRD